MLSLFLFCFNPSFIPEIEGSDHNYFLVPLLRFLAIALDSLFLLRGLLTTGDRCCVGRIRFGIAVRARSRNFRQ